MATKTASSSSASAAFAVGLLGTLIMRGAHEFGVELAAAPT
jgi:hypothetical protein